MVTHRASRTARRLALLALAAAPLALAAPAQAGCFATATLSPAPTVGQMAAGTPWHGEITVRQHGTRLVGDATPAMILRGETETRAMAQPTDRLGVYAVEITPPAAGTFAVALEDGFERPMCSSVHELGNVDVAAGSGLAATGGGGSGGTSSGGADDFATAIAVGAFALGAVALAATGIGFALAGRRERRRDEASTAGGAPLV